MGIVHISRNSEGYRVRARTGGLQLTVQTKTEVKLNANKTLEAILKWILPTEFTLGILFFSFFFRKTRSSFQIRRRQVQPLILLLTSSKIGMRVCATHLNIWNL